jgi:hypothetical protein
MAKNWIEAIVESSINKINEIDFIASLCFTICNFAAGGVTIERFRMIPTCYGWFYD